MIPPGTESPPHGDELPDKSDVSEPCPSGLGLGSVHAPPFVPNEPILEEVLEDNLDPIETSGTDDPLPEKSQEEDDSSSEEEEEDEEGEEDRYSAALKYATAACAKSSKKKSKKGDGQIDAMLQMMTMIMQQQAKESKRVSKERRELLKAHGPIDGSVAGSERAARIEDTRIDRALAALPQMGAQDNLTEYLDMIESSLVENRIPAEHWKTWTLKGIPQALKSGITDVIREPESSYEDVKAVLLQETGYTVHSALIVQSFYEEKGVNLKQIATQMIPTVSSTEKCAL